MNTATNYKSEIGLKVKSLEQYVKERYPTKEKRLKADERFLRLRLGYEIYVARKRKKLTQTELARKLKTKQSVVARIETGEQNLTTDKLGEIAKILGRELKIEFI